MGGRALMANALLRAAMLWPVIRRIRGLNDEGEITRVVNEAIDRGWLDPDQLPLLLDGIEGK